MKKIFLLLIFICRGLYAFQPGELFIVVPGTWAIKAKWYTLGGDFFSAVQRSVANKGHKVIWFRWLSENSESSRQAAAYELAYVIDCLASLANLHIIAHSHGVNVALGACQILAQRSLDKRIKNFYALAAPVYEETYKPDMRIIGRLFNLYSLNDAVQTVVGHQRVFASQAGITNMRTFVDGKEPNHSEMHSEIIGNWLVGLSTRPCPNPAHVYFSSMQAPVVKKNTAFERELEQDKPLNLASLFDFRRK